MAEANKTRRDFLKRSAVGAIVAAAGSTTTTSAKAGSLKHADGDAVRIGVIGVGKRGFGALLRRVAQLKKAGRKVELTAVADVYEVNRQRAAAYVKTSTGKSPAVMVDYREMLDGDQVDAVVVATPDHWHAKQTRDALLAGKHVYCEKPMTHTLEEAEDVVAAWQSSGRVMQVGVQATTIPVWDAARAMIDEGKLGKVVQFQTQYFRNSKSGMWREYELTESMNEKTIDWPRWLGVEEGLAPMMPFDRAVYRQWRCYWPFGYGMLSDLFVHRMTVMLKATGLRYPGRVTGAGGIFMEYDGRDVPDVATIAADFHEGVQGVVSSTMMSSEVTLDHAIRGHHGTFVFSNALTGKGAMVCEFVPERPQVTLDSSLKPERYEFDTSGDLVSQHLENWLDAIEADDPAMVNCPPDLGAAAVAIVNLAGRSYREGKVFQVDRESRAVSEGNGSWAAGWEAMSQARAKPRHVPGWKAGDAGSLLVPPEHMRLAGPVS